MIHLPGVWVVAFLATQLLQPVAAEKLFQPKLYDGRPLLAPRAFIRPGRISDDIDNAVPGISPPAGLGDDINPPAGLGDRPQDAPDTNGVGILPKRPLAGPKGDDLDAPNTQERDPYVPPDVPDLSQKPSVALNDLSVGEAKRTYHPCSPSRYNEKECLEYISVGADIMQELFGALTDDNEGDSSTISISQPAQTRSGAATPTIGTVETSLPVMPNLNMSMWMSGTKYVSAYTPQEFALLRDDPLCFFAVQERIYRAYATLDLSSSSANPAPTSSNSEDLSKRQIGCHNAPELCKSPEEKAKTLYLGYLPDQIHLVYKYTPTEVTVQETGTASCEGFTMKDQVTVPAFETTYGVFEYRKGGEPSTTSETEGPTSAPVEDAGTAVSVGIVVMMCLLGVAIGELL
ncbi:hypothetical protein LIA77_00927 [Sarocladium implicatum]|nr:hypothetical protein LIA77_00927 [Sarocladium implicatum]